MCGRSDRHRGATVGGTEPVRFRCEEPGDRLRDVTSSILGSFFCFYVLSNIVSYNLRRRSEGDLNAKVNDVSARTRTERSSVKWKKNPSASNKPGRTLLWNFKSVRQLTLRDPGGGLIGIIALSALYLGSILGSPCGILLVSPAWGQRPAGEEKSDEYQRKRGGQGVICVFPRMGFSPRTSHGGLKARGGCSLRALRE